MTATASSTSSRWTRSPWPGRPFSRPRISFSNRPSVLDRSPWARNCTPTRSSPPGSSRAPCDPPRPRTTVRVLRVLREPRGRFPRDRQGDKGGRVMALDERGHRIVAQCKHTTTGAKVGADVVYQMNGTAGPAHGADVAVVVTNGSFTRGARENAAEFRIHLLDRQDLALWASDGCFSSVCCG
ncbi:restriction endonuclease [Planotetraspora sp. A-T 1434]|nr:restriction endonuclease [Planotetraspora sp. A-T 1434]